MDQAPQDEAPVADRAGLTEEEAASRLAARADDRPPRTSRSSLDIVRANVCTRFNALLGALFVAVLVVGLTLLARLTKPLTRGRCLLVAVLAVAYLLALVVPPVRDFFALNVPPPVVVLAAIGSASLAIWAFDIAVRSQDERAARLGHLRSRRTRARPAGKAGGDPGKDAGP